MSATRKICVFAVAIVAKSMICMAESPSLGYSGMAKYNDNSYIVVHDAKFHQTGHRVGMLNISKNGGFSYRPVTMTSWKHKDGRASDLESICSIPDKASEYLMAESGYWDGKYGRIFHIRIHDTSVEVLHVYQLPKTADINDNATRNNFEGITCIQHKSELLVLLGERGGSKAHEYGYINIGVLDYANKKLTWKKYDQIQITVFPPGNWINTPKKRDISDLYADSNDIIWAVATEDNGDNGPFRSIIYKAAMVSITNSDTPILRIPSEKASWIIDGFKVESLAAAPATILDAIMSIATEDENYNGTWRPLYQPIE